MGGKLDVKMIPGTEEDIEADLIVSAIGQAVDFSGLERLNNGRGGINADKNYQVQGQESLFVGGDVVRPHLLTTAVGHGAIAAEGIDRFLRSEPLDKRPKIDVHGFDLMRKLVEKGIQVTAIDEPLRGTDSSPGAVHNFDNRSDRYVISHKASCTSATSTTHRATGARWSRSVPTRRWPISRSVCCRCWKPRPRPRPSAA